MVTSAVEEMAEGGGESSGGKAGLQLPAPVILTRTSPGGPFARGTIDAAHAKVPLVNSTGSTVAVARACLTRMADARTGLATMTVDTVLAAGVEKSQLLPGEATTIEIAGTIPARYCATEPISTNCCSATPHRNGLWRRSRRSTAIWTRWCEPSPARSRSRLPTAASRMPMRLYPLRGELCQAAGLALKNSTPYGRAACRNIPYRAIRLGTADRLGRVFLALPRRLAGLRDQSLQVMKHLRVVLRAAV
jgi:hypothetical protein